MEGLDPAKEHFVPLRRDTGRLRVYMLKGDNTAMVSCRDTVSTWKSELEEGIPAEEISGAVIDLTSDLKDRKIRSVSVYDPWKDAWSGLGRKTAVRLPDFKRSVIVKIEY